ncbi:hypothetical protein DMQ71_05305 [Klebsiella quasipneumoniae]|nr:hypothetical protein DMQ71_05305 [Klebsiella quasipneumoniae]
MLSFAAANVGFVTLKLPARGAGAFVCSCQVICQVCQTDVKNASAEAWSTCADFIAGWRLRLARPGGFVRPVLDLPTCATETAGAGRSPGEQGAAATGRRLCAPCAVRDITQRTNRERKLR